MIKYIEDYRNCLGNEQYKKMQEELEECKDEYRVQAKNNERQELWDLLQTIFTRFYQMGLTKEDIEYDAKLHYEKETLRGRRVVEIKGKDYKDKIIDGLLLRIAELEKTLYKKDDLLEFSGQTKLVEIVKKCASNIFYGGCSNCECNENQCLEYLNATFEDL